MGEVYRKGIFVNRKNDITAELRRSSLNDRQQLFVEAYLAKPNATEAAIKAGYSKKTAYSIGQRLLKKVEIQKFLERRVENAAMSADEVLKELTDIAGADWREFVKISYDREGNERDATLLLKDKIKALDLLGRYHKLFTEKVEHTGRDGGPIETNGVFKIEITDD